MVYGARISLEVSFGSMLLASLIGGTAAIFAAYKGGILDTISNALMTLILAFPAALAVIAILSFWMPTTPFKLILIIGISGIPLIFRVVRGATLAAARKEYVLAAHVQGAKTPRIIFKEIIPAVWPTAVAFFILGVASVIMLEGALAFLGLSVQTPAFSWGTLLNDARQKIYPPNQNFNMLIWPCLDMVLFLVSLNFIGDRLRSYFDITEGKLRIRPSWWYRIFTPLSKPLAAFFQRFAACHSPSPRTKPWELSGSRAPAKRSSRGPSWDYSPFAV